MVDQVHPVDNRVRAGTVLEHVDGQRVQPDSLPQATVVDPDGHRRAAGDADHVGLATIKATTRGVADQRRVDDGTADIPRGEQHLADRPG
nr:hypothetical protein [Micromonospora sp. M71_S20]